MDQRPYEKLIAWQESFGLCLWIYEITKRFPKEETYSLSNQMRRAAQSVSMNIAEGNARRSSKEKARFFEMSIASLDELHCQCRIAHGLQYIDVELFKKADAWTHRTSYLINRLRSSLLQ